MSGRADIGEFLGSDVGSYSSRICLMNCLAIGLWEASSDGWVDNCLESLESFSLNQIHTEGHGLRLQCPKWRPGTLSALFTVIFPPSLPALTDLNERPTDQLKGIGSWGWRRQGLMSWGNMPF